MSSRLHKVNSPPGDDFLTAEEKRQIRQNYNKMLETMKPEDLMIKLFEGNHVTSNEKSNFKAKTDTEKSQYIIEEVFLKAPYAQLCQIRKILINSRISGHVEIAKLFPSRGEHIEYETYHESIRPSVPKMQSEPIDIKQPVAVSEEHAKGSNSSCGKGSVPEALTQTDVTVCDLQSGSYEAAGPSARTSTALSQSQSFTSVSSMERSLNQLNFNDVHSSAVGVNASSPSRSFNQTRNPSGSSFHSEGIPQLGFYPVKEGNNPETGEGLCVVLGNFLGELVGYEKDIANVEDFFKNVLKYKNVFVGEIGGKPLNNLSREQMMEVLKVVQGFLANPLSGNRIDRFFLFILSHGDEEGILTCEEGTNDTIELDADGRRVHIRIQEIVDMFTHDKVPYLKDFPKVIFQQTCQGAEYLRAAYKGGDQSIDIHAKPLFEPSKRKLAVGADVMVCEATSKRKMSWVSDERGSLFLQAVLQVFKRYYRSEHLCDMLVEVNRVMANMSRNARASNDTGSSNEIMTVHQMPGVYTQLTRKFYLACPKDSPVFY